MINTANTIWVLLSGMLVLLMTPGLAFFYGGLASRRDAINTLVMCFSCLVTIPILWAVIGFSLVFSDFNGFIGGLNYFALHGLTNRVTHFGQIPGLVKFFYEVCFATISSAIIAGAVAGRIKFKAFVYFSLLWNLFVYVPIAHWLWNANGWLAQLGVIDYAGGLVVHVSAGFSALACAAVLGPRKTHLLHAQYTAHNIPFVMLGAGLLLFGWFGFNGGSSFAVNNIAALSITNTLLAAATAGATWIIIAWIRHRYTPAVPVCTAMVIGLVAITPAAGFVSISSAMWIGVIAGVLVYIGYQIKTKIIPIDDTYDVFLCHGLAGVCGALLTGVFAEKAINNLATNGVINGNWHLLGIEAIASVVVISYCLILSAAILWLLKCFMPIRVSEQAEHHSIDLSEHGEHAYLDR